MLIELAQLPPNIAEQIKQVQFVSKEQLAKKAVQEPSSFYDVIMAYQFPDVADIELPEFDRSLSKFDDPFEDD